LLHETGYVGLIGNASCLYSGWPGSNFGQNTNYPEVIRDFPQSFHINAGIVPEIKPPQHPFQFIVHKSYHSELCGCEANDNIVKFATNKLVKM
jgi:hypothetical protein